ncbi:MAG: hypothetical protein HZC41_02745 [Chloroflexi bacterium]|nr:hypothetical protein [Chloroflexota bacterium]
MIRTKAYDELIDFLTSSPSPEQIVTFSPSPITQARVKYLLLRKRAGSMTASERAELDEFNRIEYLMRRLINEARRKISTV